MFQIVNVHQRHLSLTAQEVDQRLSRLGTPADDLWPSDKWIPIVLDASPDDGGAGGHGPVRYHCSERRPGLVRFTFDEVLGSNSWDGYHQLTVTPQGETCTLQHTIRVRTRLWPYIQWLVMVRPLHDALLEDLLAQAAGVPAPKWSGWVRLLRSVQPAPKAS